MPTVTLRVKALMEERQLTVMDLARSAGVNYYTVLDIAGGKYKRIGLEIIAKLCAALDVQPGELFEYQK